MIVNNWTMKAGLLTILLLCCCILSKRTSAAETAYQVPNPFKGLTKDTAKDYYFITASHEVNGHHELIEEYFSPGQGLVYILHKDPSGKSQPWALLVDGREARSYIVHNANDMIPQESDCELDYLHSHKHLFPWQFVYDIDEVTNEDERGRKSNKATIYGMFAVWLNLIQNKVSSNEVGPHSQYPNANSWKLTRRGLEVEMLFDKSASPLTSNYATAQSVLDKTKLKKLMITADVRYKDSSVERQVEILSIEEYYPGLKGEYNIRIHQSQRQLAVCNSANRKHWQFPNLMRAMASSSERLYRIDYVTKRYDSYGLGKLDGKYNDKHHRFMWPNELTSEMFSLNHDIQTIIYDPSFSGARTDLFMSRFTENPSGKSARHATAYYHVMRNDEEKSMSCTKGEHEPKPKYRLLSSPFAFHTADGVEYEGHVHGLGALLLNAAHLHYKSLSLFDLKINQPANEHDLDNRRPTRVTVWQMFDEHDKVRVLFYFQKRNSLEQFQWDLSDRDRNELSWLIRVDLRRAPANMGDEMSLTINQALVDDESDLLAQFFIFDFEFELDEYEAGKYLEVPAECKQGTSSADDQDSSDEDEDLIDETADNYDKPYDESNDSDKRDDQEADMASEFQQLEGLETSDTPLPDFIEMIGDRKSYQFVTRLELLRHDDFGGGEFKKNIWLRESMDLEAQQLTLKVYLSRETLEKDEPFDEFFIEYRSELVFKVTQDKRCLRLDDVDSKWLRLFSSHLYYYVVIPTTGHTLNKELAKNDFVIESNRLSTYGIGVFWRRASQSGLAEYLGTRRKRVVRDGRKYRQLEWLYEEFGMSMRITFLLEEDKAGGHVSGAKPKLDSILILNEYDAVPLYHFKTIKATVEQASIGDGASVSVVPPACHDQLIEARRMIEVEQTEPPSVEKVLGPSGSYELEYTISTRNEKGKIKSTLVNEWNNQRLRAKIMSTRVNEWHDRRLKRTKMAIHEPRIGTELDIYIDGISKRLFAMSKLAGKCTLLTSLGPTLASLHPWLAFEHEQFDADQMQGLLGLWQTLSKRQARVRAEKGFDVYGDMKEYLVYTFELVKPSENGKPELHEEVKMYFAMKKSFTKNKKGSCSSIDNDKIKKSLENDLKLDHFLFKPIQKQSSESSDYKWDPIFTIYVHYHEAGGTSNGWKLPEECEKLIEGDASDATSPETPPVGDQQFPKLSDLFYRSSRLHMRSEVNIKGALDTLFLVDELYNGRDVRIRTQGIGKQAEKNCDLLLFQETFDQFDLSTPLKCNRLHVNETSNCLQMNLNDVWLGQVTRVQTLASLHYGPLTMWKLAEKSAAMSAKPIKTIEFVHWRDDQTWEMYREQMERELSKQVWLISGKETGLTRLKSDWSYQMEFVKHQRQVVLADGSESMDEWHVLERITAVDVREGVQFQVNIEVINYNYEPNGDEFRAMFRLPEGWNCGRKLPPDESAKQFELDLNLSRGGVNLDYEASLEMFDVDNEFFYKIDKSGQSGVKLPEGRPGYMATLVGKYVTGGHLSTSEDSATTQTTTNTSHLELSVHQSVTRFAIGRAVSRRLITDLERLLEYELDLASGACKISTIATKDWELRFTTEDGKETRAVDMFAIGGDLRHLSDGDLFKRLFVDNLDKDGHQLFSLVNKFVKETAEHKVLHTSYERELNLVRLANGLSGPARIVRKFERILMDEAGTDLMYWKNDNLRLVNFMTVQVYLLDSTREKLRSILTIRLQVNPPAKLAEFLGLASVADCFNEVDPLAHRQLESFTLEYPMLNQFNQEVGHRWSSILRNNFYTNLLRLGTGSAGESSGQLLPLQLDGRAHLKFGQHDHLLRVHFNVLEAPTAIIHFKKRFECALNEQMEAISELRLLPNEAACSRWCDQVECLAMSYCADHKCRVATEMALFGETKNKSLIEKTADLRWLAACAPHNSCTYYYNNFRLKPTTLSRLRDYLDRVVNLKTNEEQLNALSLPINLQQNDLLAIHGQVAPIRFYESREKFRWQHEEFDDLFELDGVSNLLDSSRSSSELQIAASSFVLWKSLSQFNINKVAELNEELGLGPDSKFVSSLTVAWDECLEECQRNQCLLVALCKRQHRCEMISATGSKAIMSLGALKRESILSYSPECSISIRDHLDKFHLFEGSQKPDKFWHRLDDYTAAECAAACQLNKAQCLAFDLCTLKEETSGKLPERSVCFLQNNHVAQDSFDRSVLLPSWETIGQAGNRNTIDNRKVSCNHYSKSVVAEFRRVPNAKLKEPHASVLRGVSVDKCAAHCFQDDTCRAFELCQSTKWHPMQSCYLIRVQGGGTHWLDSLSDEQPSDRMDVIESKRQKLDEHLVPSSSCSIYVAKDVLLQERIDLTLPPEIQKFVSNEPHFAYGPILMTGLYLLIAANVGAFLQFVYFRTTGKTLSLRPNLF